MFYVIYKITNKLNGRIYIGKHQTNNIDDGYMGSSKHLKYAIKKYGVENFEKEILFQFDNKDQMNAKEAELVTEEFCLRHDTYNLCPGGHGGWGYVNTNGFRTKGHSREMYDRISDKLSNMTLLHRSTNMKINHLNGKIRYDTFTGKTHSDETKKKISEANSKMVGVKNSQFGTMWITNGAENKKIKKTDVIPDGWYKGRHCLI